MNDSKIEKLSQEQIATNRAQLFEKIFVTFKASVEPYVLRTDAIKQMKFIEYAATIMGFLLNEEKRIRPQHAGWRTLAQQCDFGDLRNSEAQDMLRNAADQFVSSHKYEVSSTALDATLEA